jgi:steroid delta-isomerase-like uncharacterized protein
MPVRSPVDIVTSYLDAATAGDAEAMAALCSADFVFDVVHRDAEGRNPFNAEGGLRFWQNWFGAFSAFDWEITRAIDADDVVVVEWTFVGKQDGSLEGLFRMPVPVSNKVVRFRGASFFECRDGKIAQLTLYMDLATLMVELGVST